MNENENKTDAAVEQPENTQSVAAAQAPDTQPDAGTDVERPADAPRDGEGCESVTVIVAETLPNHPGYAKLAARSVKANLVGVDAIVAIMGYDKQMPMAEALLRMLEEVGTERIILMTDDMFILNPVTIYELGCRRGELNEKGVLLGECRTPKLMHKSVLLKMLPEFIKTYAAFNVLLEYGEYATPQVMPVIMRPWNQDNWLLPIVSEKPNPEALQQWAKTQRFMYVERQEFPNTVLRFLEERFPE